MATGECRIRAPLKWLPIPHAGLRQQRHLLPHDRLLGRRLGRHPQENQIRDHRTEARARKDSLKAPRLTRSIFTRMGVSMGVRTKFLHYSSLPGYDVATGK